ncbi:MAG: MBL fold metallo-hydrolase [Cyclobacteriaceae bacterium]|nr:MBL fold metallo-hydrolase [Cyclobacteriaceae bacterium]
MASKIFSVIVALTLILSFAGFDSAKEPHALLENQRWIPGSSNCKEQSDPLIQVVQYNSNTWILRQNKCIHYEAPFMYLFLGKEKALLVDTGASEKEMLFPLYDVVSNIIQGAQKKKKKLKLIIAHTHSHSDHHAGDIQFKGKPDVDVAGLTVEEIKKFFSITHWPDGNAKLDLGERLIDIIPIPGHHESSIALYDQASKLLLTGDTFYPGRLYVDDWLAFKKSISILNSFAASHEVSYITGNHIEMSLRSGVDYPTGSTFHPEEQRLPLTVEELRELHEALSKSGDTPERMVFAKFIVTPK